MRDTLISVGNLLKPSLPFGGESGRRLLPMFASLADLWNDTPSRYYRSQCQEFTFRPPPEDWIAVIEMHEKRISRAFALCT